MRAKILTILLAGLLAFGLPHILGAQQEEPLIPSEVMLPEEAPSSPAMQGAKKRMIGIQRWQQKKRQFREMYLERIKEQDPERYQRLLKIKELAEKYRQSESEAEKKKIEKQLRPLLDAELKAQQEDAKKKIAQLEKKLKEMKKILKKREQNWDEVVDYNLKKITGQMDYLEFPGLRPPPRIPEEPGPPAHPHGQGPHHP